jgi:organic radical activating enzyme
MLVPDTFAFHVTYTCPLTCAHCCFGSSPDLKDSLDPNFVLETIDQIPDYMKLVAFTGGEPFLHGSKLARYVERATSRGFMTRVVTSAYFAKTPALAKSKLGQLVSVGLKQLSISWDDFHEEFVAFECVKNLTHAALDAGIVVAINIVQTDNCRWTLDKVRAGLQLPDPSRVKIKESGINITGRAAEKLTDEPLKQIGYLGPCPFILTGPTLSAKGNLMPCCGVIPNTDRLTVARAPKPNQIAGYIDDSLSNPLFLWLFLRGPYAIMEWIAERYGVALPPRESIGGNCEACKLLFETPAFEEKIDDVMHERMTFLASELILLESLYEMQEFTAVRLWEDRSQILSRQGALIEP